MKKQIIRYTAIVRCLKDGSVEEHSMRAYTKSEFKELIKHLYYCEMNELEFLSIRPEYAKGV